MEDQVPDEQMPLAEAAAAKYPLYLVDSARIGSASARRIIFRFRELLIMLDSYPEQYLTASKQSYTGPAALASKVHRSLLELLRESEELGLIHSFIALLSDAQQSGYEAEQAALQALLNSSQALSPHQSVLASKRAALALLERIPGRGAIPVAHDSLEELRREIYQREALVTRDIIVSEYQLMRLGYALDIQYREDGLVMERNPEKVIPISAQLKKDLRYVEEMRVLSNPTLRARILAG